MFDDKIISVKNMVSKIRSQKYDLENIILKTWYQMHAVEKIIYKRWCQEIMPKLWCRNISFWQYDDVKHMRSKYDAEIRSKESMSKKYQKITVTKMVSKIRCRNYVVENFALVVPWAFSSALTSASAAADSFSPSMLQ